MQSTVFKLSDLQKKKETKKNPDFIAKLRIDEDETKSKENERRLEKTEGSLKEPGQPGEQEEPSKKIEEKKHPELKFTNKTNETLVDRNLILMRLKRPVESSLLSKSISNDIGNDIEKENNDESPIMKEPVKKKGRTEKEPVVEETPERNVLEDDVEEPEMNIDKELEKAKIDDIDLEEREPVETVDIEKEPEEDQHKTSIKRGRKKGKEVSTQSKTAPFDLSTAKIGDLLIKDRLPSPGKYAVPASSYYMNNRKIYISELAKLFRPYSEKIAAKATELSCKTLHSSSGPVDFELLTHQLVVRDYLNLYTPYRGLLLYHGLGSGKTCTSIGIAEGMKSGKQVVLMTPASLKMNFFNELKKCGDLLYKKNQYWEFVSIRDDIRRGPLLAQVLGLDIEYVRKHNGAWLMNVKKQPNFASLSDNDQKSVDQQIDHMIRNKYLDINYNGLQQRHLDELTHGGRINPFDNKVVIVDEAHNLVSRIANTGKKRGSIAARLYKDLMDATNAKIIFLTGTPIINTPIEIAILFNMLRGYIKTWTFTLQTTTTDKINTEILMNAFREEGLTMYDYVEYSTNKLVITRNPFGFVNIYKRAERQPRRGGSKKKRASKGSNKTKKVREPVDEIYDDDIDNIITEDEDTIRQREYNELNNVYEGGLSGGGALEDYAGVRLDEMGNISDHVFETRLIKILNNMDIRVVGKPKITKNTCLPDDEKIFFENFINGEKGELMNTDVLKRRILGLTSYFRSAQEQLLPSFVKTPEGDNYNIINVNMSDYQFEEYEKIRKVEREEERKRRKKELKHISDPDSEINSSTYRIYSRSACNFVFPIEYPRPIFKDDDTMGMGKIMGMIKAFHDFDTASEEELKSRDDFFEEEEDPEEVVKRAKIKDKMEVVKSKIAETYKFLTYDPSRKRSKEYLTEDQLGIYSPKYLEVLRNIKKEENRGLHLIYSQFKTLEGLGLFKAVLESNGFVEFKLIKTGGQWEIKDYEKDPEKPRFARYTGDETSEEKDIIRNIYNGAWNLVPPSIVEKIRERNADNLYGEVIKVLMISASGAEGINLRNTRYVHVMEPYWNMVRIDQVVGRARRICSHEDLPEELRTVEVFIYLCRATPEQIEKNIELRIKDLSKLAYKIYDEKKKREIEQPIPFTTDQYMLEIAHIKDSITKQVLRTVKETAMDCSLYNNNPDEPLVCYGFGRVEPQSFASYPTLERDTQEKPARKTEKMELKAIKVGDVKYAVDKNSLIVYDMESYKKAKEKRGELVAVGKYDERTNSIKFS